MTATLDATGSAPPVAEDQSAPLGGGRRRAAIRQLARDWRISVGLMILTVIALAVVLGPRLAPYRPDDVTAGLPLSGSSPSNWLGTDHLGRDVASRLLAGARLTVLMAATVSAISVVLGTAVGLLVGFLGGRVDFLVSRAVDLLLAFPGLLIALVVITYLQPGVRPAVIAMVVIYAPLTARLVRGVVVAERSRGYVAGARVVGVPSWRLLLRHILPNTRSQILVIATVVTGYAVLTEASLSFLGLGAPPGTPTWGRMLAEGRPFLTIYPVLAIAPGVAIALLILALNLLGDGLRDHLDPTSRLGRGGPT